MEFVLREYIAVSVLDVLKGPNHKHGRMMGCYGEELLFHF